MERSEEKGIIFNIQHFSINDGPGIRTVVFMKGCPLRCRWCANPESQRHLPEIGWTSGECISCGSCVRELMDLGISFDPESGVIWDRAEVTDPDAAARIRRTCPAKALHVIGEEKTVTEVLREVEKEGAFYRPSGGGLTLSGGEPLMQPAFTCAILRGARRRRIHTAIETSGYASWEVFREVLSLLDYLLIDVKCLDPEKHRTYTGVSNEEILRNLRRAREAFPDLKIRIRTPVIPGVNDTEDEIRDISALARELSCEYEILKYHKLGEPKYASLHRPYPMGDAELSDEFFTAMKRYEIRLYPYITEESAYI